LRQYKKKVKPQRKAAAIRAKYGASGRPSLVVVKSLTTGEVLAVKDQSLIKGREYSPTLNALARQAGYANYDAYVHSSYWKKIRQRVLERDARRCRMCGSEVDLTVHHDRYDFIGDERLEYLKTMCARCHRGIHR
jgi:ribosomal protein S27AE